MPAPSTQLRHCAQAAKRVSSGIRRCSLAKDGLSERPAEGVNTVYDIILYAARVHGSRKALGWRDVVQTVEEEKEVTKVVEGKEVKETKKWKYFELSPYKYISFIEVKEAVGEVARALLHLGVTDKDVFNIYAQTSANWQLMAHACGSISTTIATAYDTLGEDGLAHSLNEPDCVGLFTNAELLPTLLRVLPRTPAVKYIIFDGEPTQQLVDNLHAVRESIQVFSLDKLRELGRDKPSEGIEARRPKPETVACIMYTSGSTGNPKGVVITHGNLVASVGAVRVLLGHHLTYEDSFLAYLPLAHVLEYIVELIMLFVGMPTGYGRVKTLTDASRVSRPSIMVGVPAVWETIRKGILAKVAAVVRSGRVFSTVPWPRRRRTSPFSPNSRTASSSPASALQQVVGSALPLSGGAAISRETQEFLTTALVTVLQGYGMTETCGMCAILPPELMRYNSVGLPVPSCEVKLLDVPDAGYLSTNDPPQGEVLIRGNSVTGGYYKRPDLNNDETVFTKDGWLRTGDVGQWNPDGTLSLIDRYVRPDSVSSCRAHFPFFSLCRLKNLIKLASGEYIALERLEAIYKSCNLVANICVHAVPEAQQPMAVIIPHEAHLRNYLLHKGIATLRRSSMSCECRRQENGFKAMEILQAVVLTAEEWTPESGLVTAAQKIQRVKIAHTFKAEIDAVYKHKA
ncbi:long-chain-fatty-acid-CoA-ligase [Ephemerocybe angulata]|uniref:Long-chain-fatty-acid-CoA-ligase n=1 Tax=Ephemerocybe angulata TaxID=980116 RepID=A0A8H6LW24_9AGAR|nr:long-chain-fatty-acid-CoA-ligase [Tulosesus angulatus]